MSRISHRTYQDYYDGLFGEIKLKIVSQDDYIIAESNEDLVEYYMENALNPIEFNPNKEETIEHKKLIKTIYARERELRYQQYGNLQIECECIIVKMPILSNSKIEQILELRTNLIFGTVEPRFTIEKNNFVIEVEIKGYGCNLSNEQVQTSILSNKDRIQKMVSSKNVEINTENLKLKQRLTQFINDRKNKLNTDKNRLNDLVKLVKIPLVRKDGEIVKQIQVNKKPFVSRIKPKTLDEDYQLDREKVIDIIRLLNNQCIQFEKTPKTYEKLDEPNLRDLLLSNLNSIFEGQATGETFNNQGKADIYLNIDKGNILVAECKFYGGPQLYHRTIEQLLGYLTWRQNYGIMLSFCKKKNSRKLLKKLNLLLHLTNLMIVNLKNWIKCILFQSTYCQVTATNTLKYIIFITTYISKISSPQHQLCTSIYAGYTGTKT